MRELLGAIQFLTIVPVRTQNVDPGRAALFFPFVGALLGWSACGVFLASRHPFNDSLAAALVLVFLIGITGALHEDGLADVADAFRSYRSSTRILEILKDPRIGAFGAIAIGLSLLLRWQAMTVLDTALLPSLVASQAVPRAGLVILGYVSRPAGFGMGAEFCRQLKAPVAAGVLCQGVLAALWCGLRPGLAIVCVTAALIAAARLFFDRRLGGINGDCLGAAAQVMEIAILLLLSCANCSW
jgi:adenosylcobinamide-GDP ribazoletransferase